MRRRPPSPKIFDHTRSGVKTPERGGIHQSVGETIASAARPGISPANLEHRRAQRVADLIGRKFGRFVDRPRAAQKKLVADLKTAVDAIPAVRSVKGGTRKERAQRQREIAALEREEARTPQLVTYDETAQGISREEWDAIEAEAKKLTVDGTSDNAPSADCFDPETGKVYEVKTAGWPRADRPTPIEDDPDTDTE